MPLNTQIRRNDEVLPVKWGDFHVAAMVLAATFDSGEGPFNNNDPAKVYTHYESDRPIYIPPSDTFALASYPVIATTPLNGGSYVLEHDWGFVDCMDGECFGLSKGDELIMFRTMS